MSRKRMIQLAVAVVAAVVLWRNRDRIRAMLGGKPSAEFPSERVAGGKSTTIPTALEPRVEKPSLPPAGVPGIPGRYGKIVPFAAARGDVLSPIDTTTHTPYTA